VIIADPVILSPEHEIVLRDIQHSGDQYSGFCQVFGCFEDSACSHRLRGLPSSAGSPSLLHLRALAPQRPVVSFRQGTVEPQPPPHASSVVVAWPIARQGFYGGQPTRYPSSDLSPGRSHSPHPMVTGSYDDRLTCKESLLEHRLEMTESTAT
jgi:hypothetical protein